MHTSNIRKFIHTFFIIKKVDFYILNSKIINDFQKKPGLCHISKKRGVDVGDVYNIVKTHDINILNTNIIKLMEFK